MTNEIDNRVLSRRRAHEMSPVEVELVSGGFQAHTNVCSAFNPKTLTGFDGDGCSGDIDHS